MKKVLFAVIALFFIIQIVFLMYSCSVLTDDTDNALDYHTKFIAHRGYSSLHFENTEAAFIAAGQSDFFWGIETDIWPTSDGVWVCAHDINPFEDESLLITEMTYQQAILEPLRLTNKKHPIETEAEFICSFKRYLEICAEYNKTAVIEFKFTADTEQVNHVISEIQKVLPLEQTMFISFNATTISRLQSANKNIIVQNLTYNLLSAGLLIAQDKHIGIRYDLVDESFIATCKEKGILLNLWTINDIEIARDFLNLEVDFITTDFVFDFSIE